MQQQNTSGGALIAALFMMVLSMSQVASAEESEQPIADASAPPSGASEPTTDVSSRPAGTPQQSTANASPSSVDSKHRGAQLQLAIEPVVSGSLMGSGSASDTDPLATGAFSLGGGISVRHFWKSQHGIVGALRLRHLWLNKNDIGVVDGRAPSDAAWLPSAHVAYAYRKEFAKRTGRRFFFDVTPHVGLKMGATLQQLEVYENATLVDTESKTSFLIGADVGAELNMRFKRGAFFGIGVDMNPVFNTTTGNFGWDVVFARAHVGMSFNR
ncbi:MAG: hypothetical protein R3A47_10035 [Polyangiales bacterium]